MRTRKLQVERLESRQLLAADLRVYVKFDQLFVRGMNAEPAAVTLEQTGNIITVTPGAGTTLNGGASAVNINVDPIQAIRGLPWFRGELVRVIMLGSASTATIGNLKRPPNPNPAEPSVDYSLDVQTGDAADAITISQSDVNLNLRTGGGTNTVNLNQMNETSYPSQGLGIQNLGLYYVGGAGDDTINIEGGVFKYGGYGYPAPHLNLSDGNNAVHVGGTVDLAHEAVIRGGAGDDTISISSATGITTVNGSLVLSLGEGANTATIDGAVVGVEPTFSFKPNSLQYSGGSQSDTLNITGGTVLKDVEFNVRGGDNVVNLTGVDMMNDLIVNGGAGNDVVTIVGSAAANIGDGAYLILGHGANEVYIHDVAVQRSLVAGTGDDNDAMCLQNVQVGGNLVATLGAGDFDTLVASGVDVSLNLTVVGGGGADNLGFLDSSAVQLTVDAGVGADGVIVRNFTAATNLVIQGGEDLDRIFVDGGSIGSRLTIQADSSIGAAGSDIVRVQGAAVAGNLRVEGGAGAFDTLIVQDSQIGANLVVLAGDGTDRILISETAGQTLSVAVDLTIAAGLDDDDILLSGAFAVTGNSKVHGGLGTDALASIAGAAAPTSVVSIENVSVLTEADFDVSGPLTELENILTAICGP